MYGKSTLTVDFKQRNVFKFIKASISKAITGANILHNFKFMVNVWNKKIGREGLAADYNEKYSNRCF